MLDEIKYHAENLSKILEIEEEEGQFEYLIDHGKNSSNFQESDKNDENKMSGCLAQVWLKSHRKDNKNYFEGDSDALIVKGLVKIIQCIEMMLRKKYQRVKKRDGRVKI